MRELHVVEVSEDGRHVLLAGKRGATRGGFRVALDDRLLAAVRGDLRRPGEDPFAAPELSPKEIQARLRAGESATSIAQSAGVPIPRVERFSGPVQGEMARMIDATRSAHLVRGRLGRSVLPLGKAVDHALAQTPSMQPESVEWETFREEDGRWLVTVTWFARARTRTASWRYDPGSKTVTATDPAAAALAHHDPDAVETPPKRRTPPAPAPAAKKSPAKKAPAKKSPAKRAVAKKAPSKAVVAKRAAAKKAPAKAAPLKRAVAKKPPVKKPPAKAAVAKKAPVKAPAARPARTLRVVPDPEQTRGRTAADRDGVKTRASVPGWADVLLGTSPGSDR